MESEYCVSTLYLTHDIEHSHSQSFCTFKIAYRYLYDFTATVLRVIHCIRSTVLAVFYLTAIKQKNPKQTGAHLKPGENMHTVKKARNDASTMPPQQ